MGGVFPAGYPVAVVSKIENNPSESFLLVRARPAARLNHGKQVLLIWPGQAQAPAKDKDKEKEKDKVKDKEKAS